MALAALWLAVPDLPFSCPPDRGGSSGPVMVTVALSCVAMNFGALHYLFASEIWFWVVAFAVMIAATIPLRQKAGNRFQRLVGGTL